MERHCSHVVKADTSNPVTRRGAFAVSNCLARCGEYTPDETAARFGTMEAAQAFINAVSQSREEIIIAATSYGTDPVPAEPTCNAPCECFSSTNELFNSEGARASCSCVSALTEFPAVSTEPTARERKARVRGRPPDSQSVQPHTNRVPMRQAQLKPEKQTAGNGWSTDPKVPATVPVLDCMAGT